MKRRTIAFLLLACLVLSSCAALPKVSEEQIARTSSAETAEVASPTRPLTDTPAPTSTPVPTATPLPTATSTKTPIPTPDYTATAAAKATQAVAEDLVEIAPILQKYEMPIDIGRLAWVQRRPVEIKVEKYNEWRVAPIDSRQTFSDFAMYVEVTWETRSGLAGCGIVFHSENTSIDGEQYRFYGLRFTGLPGWIVQGWKDNRVQSNISGDYKIDKAIILKNGSTNAYFIVMRGGILTLYANGTQLGKVDIPGRIEGYLLFLALQESMKTTCTFENAWVWSLK